MNADQRTRFLVAYDIPLTDGNRLIVHTPFQDCEFLVMDKDGYLVAASQRQYGCSESALRDGLIWNECGRLFDDGQLVEPQPGDLVTSMHDLEMWKWRSLGYFELSLGGKTSANQVIRLLEGGQMPAD